MNLPTLSLLLFPRNGTWIIISLEHALTAAGKSPEEATGKFMAHLAMQLLLDTNAGIQPLEDTPPAPEEYWERFRASKTKVILDLNELLADNPPLTPEIVGDVRLAA